MTTEELMMPRYEVVALWPDTDFHKGEIIDNKLGKSMIDFYDEYPHLFRKLPWWEKRTEEDLPQFVKSFHGNSVRKVDHYNLVWETVTFDVGRIRPINKWMPATEAEYTRFNEKQAKP